VYGPWLNNSDQSGISFEPERVDDRGL
jgi:hypothetical protein